MKKKKKNSILRAVRGDLDRAQAVAEGGAAGHGPALLQAVEQRAAPGVAAAGRVGNLAGGRGGNALALAAFPDVAAFAAQGDGQGAHAAREVGQCQTGALAQHVGFVVIDGHPVGQFDELQQLGAVKGGQHLAGVKHEGNARRPELAGVLLHGFAPVAR